MYKTSVVNHGRLLIPAPFAYVMDNKVLQTNPLLSNGDHTTKQYLCSWKIRSVINYITIRFSLEKINQLLTRRKEDEYKFVELLITAIKMYVGITT